MLQQDPSPWWAAVLTALRDGSTVVVPTRRAAQMLRWRYDGEQRAAGQTRWSPPAVRSWAGLLEEMWREMLLAGHTSSLLLNPDQEALLWRRIIQGDTMLETLAGAAELTRLAQSAWGRLCSYRTGRQGVGQRVVPGDAIDDGSVDAGAFARWASAFRDRCRRDDLLTAAELGARLTAVIGSGAWKPNQTAMRFTGFDELTPAQRQLLDALRDAGLAVSVIEETAPENSATVARTTQSEEELRACVRWCVQRARGGGRVAIVVPDMDRARPALGRALGAKFAAEFRDGLLFAEGALPFAFGTGNRLGKEPLVIAALDILRLAAEPLPIHKASRLLLSPYFANGSNPPERHQATVETTTPEDARQAVAAAGGAELAARAELDAFALRRGRQLEPETTLADLLRMTADATWPKRLPRLRRSLRAMEHFLAKHRVTRESYGRWAEWMRRLLRAAGWGAPPERMSPEERRVSESLDGALDTLATLSFTGERVSYAAALDLLTDIVKQRRVPAESGDALIQILTPEDAAGAEFDALWCLEAGERSWPTQRSIASLLPRAMQRSLKMPGADRVTDTAAATEVFRRLQRSAPEVVFSYAEQTDRERQRVTGPLRSRGLPEVRVEEIVGPLQGRGGDAVLTPLAELALPSDDVIPLPLERVADTDLIVPLPDRVLRGGAGLLATQAACGFRAFAEHRLVSSTLDDAELGMDPRRTGEVVHLALQRLWEELGSRAALSAKTAVQRATLLEGAIEAGLTSVHQVNPSAWSAAFLAAERKRLRRLLDAWLEIELSRPDFTVESHERWLEDVRIGPLRLSLRVDRTDRVDGERVLIDYKTGSAAMKDWEGDRPDAPQLPLYAVLSATEERTQREEAGRDPVALGAVAIAKVRIHPTDRMRMEGAAGRTGLLPAGKNSGCVVSGDFAADIERWKKTLEALADAFANGDARVDPKWYPETCKYCAQRMLCRLDARTLEEDDVPEWVNGADGDDA